jgi:hypothetical protein
MSLRTILIAGTVIGAACLAAVGFREDIAKVAKAQGFILQDGTLVFGHLAVSGQPPPTVGGASCGTPVLTAGSSDMAGQFQAKGTSTCAVTFGKAFATGTVPFCVVVDETTASTYTVTRTGFTMGTTVSNDYINWTCWGTAAN